MAANKPVAKTIKAAGKHRALTATKDVPDLRDRWYEPSLIPLKTSIDNRQWGNIRDQGTDGACTGFGLAAVIDVLSRKNHNQEFAASTRMLYEMAKLHDEWPGNRYTGSSCRGAIRGWKSMGVCTEQQWPYAHSKLSDLSVDRAKAARNHPLGAYYRLRPDVNDYHAALNEVEALYVSATVHDGWVDPKPKNRNGLAVIKSANTGKGGHSFCIVGYNSDGFIIQNSWGMDWGSHGFALWLYEDWLASIDDGWVVRLAVPTPQIFGLTSRSATDKSGALIKPAPRRMEIAGHFVHFNDGQLEQRGDYWSTLDDIQKTADLIVANKYQHLLIYAHGGLNSSNDCARRCAALKAGFKRNGIYPVHIMYDTGLVEELKDALLRAFKSQRVQGFLQDIVDAVTDRTDTLLEDLLRKPGTAIWDEMKRDAREPFVSASNPTPDGVKVIQCFANTLKNSGLKIHLAGHSTGAIVLGHLLQALDTLKMPDLLTSCSLMAPACAIDFFEEHYRPRLNRKHKGARVPTLDVYNLNDERELDDNVAEIYRKSLLCLVSRSFERVSQQSDQDEAKYPQPLLGLQECASRLASDAAMSIYYANGKEKRTQSDSHGGFDNDVATMNTILERILGAKPKQPFLPKEMQGY